MAVGILDPRKGILWNDDPLTEEEIARQREIAEALLAQNTGAKPITHWLQGASQVVGALGGVLRERRAKQGEEQGRTLGSEAFNKIVSAIQGREYAGAGVPMTGGAGEVAATAPATGQPIDMTGNEVYNDFMGTVKSGIDLGDGTKLAVTNPYALAAVASTAKAESGFDPGNVNRTWSDPSESGHAGTAGGLMSWRGPRYDALAATGDLSPAGQARFFLQEDPALIEKLNGAKSVEEAQSLMNNAWRFAGYNRPGGEAANRLATARSFLPVFQGGGEVASVSPEAAIEAIAPIDGSTPVAGASLADEVAQFEQTPEYAAQFGNPAGQPMADEQFDARFGDTALPVEQLQGRDAIAQALMQQQGASAGQQAIAGQTGGIPITGQAAQTGGVMQAVNGTNAGGAFGLNQAQEQATRQYAQANLLQDPAFLEAMSSPYLSDQQKAIAQTLVEQQMRQQAAEREYRMKQADPAYRMGLEKTQLEIENMRNPRETPSDKLARERFDYERGTADRTNDIKNYEYYAQREAAAGRQPLGPLEWETAQRKASAASTNVTVGEGDKFYENLDKKNAETFAAMSDMGIQARGRMAQIDRLEAIMGNAPQGAVGALKQAAGEWGIETEGLSDIQAASALLEKMVPEQRAPGSGPMSDADIKMFRASLPRILNQPGGNELIFDTMRGISQYEAEMGVIADRVADREISPADGRRLIRELKNPLADFKIPKGKTTPNKGSRTSNGVDWSLDE